MSIIAGHQVTRVLLPPSRHALIGTRNHNLCGACNATNGAGRLEVVGGLGEGFVFSAIKKRVVSRRGVIVEDRVCRQAENIGCRPIVAVVRSTNRP